ncbi:hypothetical protein ACHAXT_013265 [Thalassiosira profunda]
MVAAPATDAPASAEASLLEAKRKDLLALDSRKKALQSEAEAIVSELTSEVPGGGAPMGIDTPLVDAEGFPRADIDVYRARTLRKRFKEIQTDHKELEKKVAAGLVEIAALTPSKEGGGGGVSKVTAAEEEAEKMARLAPKPKPKFDPKTGKWVVKSWDGSVAGVKDGEGRSFDNLTAKSTSALASNIAGSSGGGGASGGGTAAGSSGSQQQTSTQQRQPQVSFGLGASVVPFAIIDEVSPDSPASQAGLKENDLILKFGHVDHANDQGFRAIAELVPKAAGENGSISVAVRRTTTELGGLAEVIRTEVVELRPRTWGGRGLLGCHIRPYSE